jgi:hypothetical protein
MLRLNEQELRLGLQRGEGEPAFAARWPVPPAQAEEIFWR